VTILKVAIGSDHGGLDMKQTLILYLTKKGYEMMDIGIYDAQDPEKCHYPPVAEKMGKTIQSGACEQGILICGTGIGISIAANKMKGIRAAHVSSEFDAKYTRLHNDANVLCLGGRTMGEGLACEIAEVFLSTPFSGDERHKKRIQMIADLEESQTACK